MSIVAYYARLSVEQLSRCVNNPQRLMSGSVEDLPGAEIIDIDRAWEPLAWLVSPCKRIEEEHNVLVMGEMASERNPTKQTLGSRLLSLFRRRSEKHKQPSAAIEESLRRADEAPLDLPLVAIEGRTEVREEKLNCGMGGAAVFSPEQVANLRIALAAVTTWAVEDQYNPELMDKVMIFPQHWVEEGRDLMDNYIFPNLKKLQVFYENAAESGQTVIVWYA